MPIDQLVANITGTWGPAALLGIGLFLVFSGRLVAERTVEKLLAAKDSQLASQKEYYEGRIRDLTSMTAEQVTDLRHTRDTTSEALDVSVNSVAKLLTQSGELMEIARTVAPALVAAREAAERAQNEQG